jgi:hypothetical protein
MIMTEGGCNCRAVRYRIDGPPLSVAACHCTNCRRQSGSAYSVNIVVKASAVTVEGELASYLDHDTSSGHPVLREFCGTCGSPVRSTPQANPKIVVIKAGTADHPESLAPKLHIWTRTCLPWVDIPADMPSFPENMS